MADKPSSILDKQKAHTQEEIELASYLEDMMENYGGLLDMGVTGFMEFV